MWLPAFRPITLVSLCDPAVGQGAVSHSVPVLARRFIWLELSRAEVCHVKPLLTAWRVTSKSPCHGLGSGGAGVEGSIEGQSSVMVGCGSGSTALGISCMYSVPA